MSSPACLFFYGMRFEVPASERVLLENKTHPMMRRARDAGLGFHWHDFGASECTYYLFVGRKMAEIGVEGELGARFTPTELLSEAGAVGAKLREADIPGEPTFWLRWQPGS
jgi:hypothetical protein